MSDSPQYEAFRAFARATIALEVVKATQPLQEEIRSLRAQLETRAAQVVTGPPGQDGAPGPQGDRGAVGLPGAPGVQGERGADGVATSEEIAALVEKRVAEVQVRTFADLYHGVYESGKLYTRGLLVTWGGSLFLAMEDTTDKPETSAAWKLIVKHGRDGRK